MKRFIPLFLMLCLLLAGCSNWLDGSYHSVKPHEGQHGTSNDQMTAVASYTTLSRVLTNMVETGTETITLSLAHYDQLVIAQDMRRVIQEITEKNPIGAFAVDTISFELGTNSGEPAVAVTVTYRFDRNEISKIRKVSEREEFQKELENALCAYDPRLVLYVENNAKMDYTQWVEEYVATHPEKVMEQPQITTFCFPEEGEDQIIVMRFAYENSWDNLKNMQTQVKTLFKQAVESVRTLKTPMEKYEGLYRFLNDLNEDYRQETSITPAHSLLLNGVGDSKAIARMYTALCREAELECVTVTGTRDGEPWYWNIVECDGVYYHMDLTDCLENDSFLTAFDGDMAGYVWDYTAYPVCSEPEIPEPTA